MKNKMIKKVAEWLIAVGAINWLLVGAFKFDLVAWLGTLLTLTWFSTVIYIVVGIAGIYWAVTEFM